MDWLHSIGQTVKRENYDLVYTAPLEPCKSPQAAVEQLYHQFNKPDWKSCKPRGEKTMW